MSAPKIAINGFGRGNLAKVISRYDNEWGYSSRVEELIARVAELDGMTADFAGE